MIPGQQKTNIPVDLDGRIEGKSQHPLWIPMVRARFKASCVSLESCRIVAYTPVKGRIAWSHGISQDILPNLAESRQLPTTRGGLSRNTREIHSVRLTTSGYATNPFVILESGGNRGIIGHPSYTHKSWIGR